MIHMEETYVYTYPASSSEDLSEYYLNMFENIKSFIKIAKN